MIKYFIFLAIFFSFIFSSCTKDDTASKQGFVAPEKEIVGKTLSANEIITFKQMTIGTTNGIIIKWPKVVSIYLVEPINQTLTNDVDSIISELNTLLDTNLIISRTTNSVGATIKIYATDRNTYLVAEPQDAADLQNSNYLGLAHLNWNRSNGEIYNGTAFVDLAHTDTNNQHRILRHEIMHTLGFYGHVTMSEFDSVLFPTPLSYPFPIYYTAFDKKMIKLLYNPAIKSGMNEAELNAVLVNL
jgi:hypothetical protein